MSDPKFTPGPWTCLGPSFGDPLPRYTTEIETDWEYEGAENRQICEMPFHHHDEENEANAHLIAAAPDLYRELEMARFTIAMEISTMGPRTLDREEKEALVAEHPAIKSIDAALAKARGEG